MLAQTDARVIAERKSPEYVLGRIRAGILEQGTIDLMDRALAGARMHGEGLIHEGVELDYTANGCVSISRN